MNEATKKKVDGAFSDLAGVIADFDNRRSEAHKLCEKLLKRIEELEGECKRLQTRIEELLAGGDSPQPYPTPEPAAKPWDPCGHADDGTDYG